MLSWQGLLLMWMFGFCCAFVFLFLESILRDSLNNFGIWVTRVRYRKMMKDNAKKWKKEMDSYLNNDR